MTPFRRAFLFVCVSAATVVACGWDPSRPFEREAPEVNEAIRWYDGGEAGLASEILRDYLWTGKCEDGTIGTPDRVKEKANGSFDLGLAFFKIAESFGHRFGEEESDAGFFDPGFKGRRAESVECALKIVRKVAEDTSQPAFLRARARFVEGNLLFLTTSYQDAVSAYDKALELAPAMSDAGPMTAVDSGNVGFGADPVGRDAAWNRAIALRRIEDKKKDGGGEDGGGDGGGEGGAGDGGGGKDDKGDGGGGGQNDAGKDGGGGGGGDDGGTPPPPKKDEPDAGSPEKPPPPSRQSQDERILDQLENAPTVQHEAAKKHGRPQRMKGMLDK